MPQQDETTNDCHPAPEWLTEDYVRNRLQKRHKDTSIKIVHLDIKPVTAKGEHYASVMTRIKVEFTKDKSTSTHHESFIVKTTFEGNDLAASIMNEYGIYQREMEIYEKVLPKLAELLRETGDQDKLFADTMHVDYTHSAIIFEDLSVSSYVMADRIARLDMDHVRIVLAKLAKMHATAAVLSERQPEIFAQNYDRGIFNRQTEAFEPMVNGILSALARYVKSNDDLREKYYSKLVALRTRSMEYAARVFDSQKDHFMTLVHGDFWTNNIMFKYSDGSPQDVIPIDFQFSAWASPAVDLHYFFNTSLREEMRLHQQPELLQYYYGILAETLRALKFKSHIPSLFDFTLQVEMRSFLALTSSLVFQPVMLCEDNADAEFNNLISNSESGTRFKDTLFKNEKVQKNIERLLPIFDRKGLLDPMD